MAFFATQGRFRRRVVLAASYVFYAAEAPYWLLLLALVTIASYLGGVAISRTGRRSTLFAYIGLAAAPLITYKVLALASLHGSLPDGEQVAIARSAAVPMGISFYTLQAVSYLVDAYRRKGPLSADLETHALYLAFFPQLIAGPIERSATLLPQVRELGTPSPTDVYVGAKTMLWGYFCKLVVADNIGSIVDRILTGYTRLPAASLPMALYLYSFQIYFDFYGYSLIAIGLGRTFGVALTPNFDRPYLSRSVREFWTRWHVTLSSWLRDYIYVPLGGRRYGRLRFILAIVMTFLVSGLWHGAAPNFIAWSLIHAALFLLAAATFRPRQRLFAALPAVPALRRLAVSLQVFYCFSLISFTWLFFRVDDVSAIRLIMGRMYGWLAAGAPVPVGSLVFETDTIVFVSILALTFSFDASGWIMKVVGSVPKAIPEIAREITLVNAMVVSLVLLGDLGNRAFIYFQF